jgi:RNA polymerase sigma-70 factor (ECF subfamily)
MASEKSFEAIYVRHAAEVHRAANAILRDPALAEDVVQEVFERVWRASGHDERRGSLGLYLNLLARSRALDLWRRTRVAERAQHRLEEQAGSPPAAPELPEAALAIATERRLARAAVRRLPDDQRQAIGLAYWGGLSAQELATAEGIPLGTAKSRVRLGLAKLSRDPGLVAA